MAWFRKTKKPKVAPSKEQRTAVPEGLWVKCDACREIIYGKELERNQQICPKCGHHFRISARERIALLLDPESRQPVRLLERKSLFRRMASGRDVRIQLLAAGAEVNHR